MIAMISRRVAALTAALTIAAIEIAILTACTDDDARGATGAAVTATAAGQAVAPPPALPATAGTTATMPPSITAAAVTAAAGSVTPAPSASAAVAMPRRVTFAPGETVATTRGFYFVDPRTGAVDGWLLPGNGIMFGAVSPSGRYLVWPDYGDPPAVGLPRWSLFDTISRRLTALPGAAGSGAFSADESRYAMPVAGGVTLVRTADGMVERTVATGQPSEGRIHSRAWGASNRSFLLRREGAPVGGAPPVEIVRVDANTGETTVLAAAPAAWVWWSPDNRSYLIRLGDVVQAHDGDSDRLLWRVSAVDLGAPATTDAKGVPSGDIVAGFNADRSLAAIATRTWGSEQPWYRVFVVDGATGRLRFTVAGGFVCGPHIWSADRRWLSMHGSYQGQYGSILVAADGASVRYLSPFVEDLSPVHADTGANGGQVVELPSGTERLRLRFTGDPGWDFAHDPLWLADGRMVVHAPHGGHGGCGLGPPSTEDVSVIRAP